MNTYGDIVGVVERIWREEDGKTVQASGRGNLPHDEDGQACTIDFAASMKIEKHEQTENMVLIRQATLQSVAARARPWVSAQEVADGDATAGTAEHNRRTDWVGIAEEGAERLRAHSDIPHPSGGDRLAIYLVEYKPVRGGMKNEHRRLATTSLAGLGGTLITLQEEDEFDGYRVGVFDRQTRVWLISPWAGTSPWIPTGDD